MLDYNSGMGYGMMSGMNGMMGMGMGMMPSMNAMGGYAQSSGENYWQKLNEEYGCEDCFVPGPKLPECHMHVLPLPPEIPAMTFVKRIAKMFGF